MENLREVESVLQLKNLYFEKITFERGTEITPKFTPQFATSYREIEGTVFEVKLMCRILAGEKPFLELCLVGVFDNQGSDPEVNAELNELNTISIMFPYLRAEISLITAQPNCPTLNLPVFNINALLEELRNRKIVENQKAEK